VLAVADAFENMTAGGVGGARHSFAQAREELRQAAGLQFDPRVVAALLEALDRQALAGSTGLLVAAESKGRPDLLA
jgi:HD-GYP domain-containing protein (c-di-GMP phosphodiesterase class II)